MEFDGVSHPQPPVATALVSRYLVRMKYFQNYCWYQSVDHEKCLFPDLICSHSSTVIFRRFYCLYIGQSISNGAEHHNRKFYSFFKLLPVVRIVEI